MSITVDIGGVNFSVPETGQRGWGQDTTDLLVALSNASYKILGGSIPLTSEADFGPTAGLKAIWFASRTINSANSGVIRLANNDALNWRNGANNDNLTLTVTGASGELSASILDTDTSLTLKAGEGASFPTSGRITINSEEIAYTSKSVDTLNGLLRGENGTVASSHLIDTAVNEIDRLTFDGINVLDSNNFVTISNKTLDNTNIITVQDINLTIQDNVDNTKQAVFDVSNIATATTRTYTFPDSDGEIGLSGDLAAHIADTSTHGVSGNILGDSDTQIITNKNINANDNTILNIGTDELSNAGVTTDKIADDNVTSSKLEHDIVLPGTGAVTLPLGNTAQRPASSNNGMLRYNSDNDTFEGYGDGEWGLIGGEGEGGGEYNYIANPYAEAGTDNHTTSATTGSFVVGRTTDAAELPGTNPSAWTLSGSGVTVDDYVAIESKRAIANADTAVGTFEVSVVDVNGSLSSDWKAQLYDVDNSQYVGSEIEFQGTGTYPADAFTQPGVTYEIRMIAKVASPALVAAEFALRSETTLLSSFHSKTQAYTPTILGNGSGLSSATLQYASWAIMGDKLYITGKVTSITVPNASVTQISFSLPPGYTLSADVERASAALYADDSGAYDVGRATADYTNNTTALTMLPSTGNWSNPSAFEFQILCPVAELRNNVTPTITEKLYDNARFSATSVNEVVANNGTVLFANVEFIHGGNFANGIYTVPVSGYYTVSFNLRLQTDGVQGWSILKNNLLIGAARVNDIGVSSDRTFYCDAGDNIRLNNTSGANRTTENGSDQSYISIIKVPDTTGRAAGLLTSDRANDSKQYLLPEIRETTVNLDNEFTGGDTLVRIVRIGSVVTITGRGVTSHSSAGVRQSSTGLIPDWARPSNANTASSYFSDNAVSATVRINADGAVNTFYNTNRTDTFFPINISYVVD